MIFFPFFIFFIDTLLSPFSDSYILNSKIRIRNTKLYSKCSRRLIFSSVDSDEKLHLWSVSSGICSMPSCSPGTWLHWNRGASTCWSHSDDQVSKSLLKTNKYSIWVLEATYLYLGSQTPFIAHLFNNFHPQESNLNRKNT